MASPYSRDNSTVMSLRISNDQRDEFLALAREVGMLPSRQLRAVFTAALDDLREQANDRRSTNGLPSWEDEWNGGDGA